MALNSYSSLQLSIADWLNRSDLTSQIPDFISLAESQISRELRHYKMIKSATAGIDGQYSATPSDWLETIRFHLNDTNKTLLQQTTVEEIAKLRQSSSDAQGKPSHFSHTGDLIEVYRRPDTSYVGELLYYSKIPSLGATPGSDFNWLLTHAPDCILYGSLLQAAPFLKDDERIPVWGGIYQATINSLNGESDNTRFSSSGLRLNINSY
tara:strand:+ start:781 stop:1407 length:627 start_codon:yes stop_codon:yes gene_type:complete